MCCVPTTCSEYTSSTRIFFVISPQLFHWYLFDVQFRGSNRPGSPLENVFKSVHARKLQACWVPGVLREHQSAGSLLQTRTARPSFNESHTSLCIEKLEVVEGRRNLLWSLRECAGWELGVSTKPPTIAKRRTWRREPPGRLLIVLQGDLPPFWCLIWRKLCKELIQ